MRFSLLLFSLLIMACASKKNTTPSAPEPPAPPATSSVTTDRRMDSFTFLRLCMTGEFSSELQSKKDSDFFSIHLRMVPIWKQSPTAFYLYVEQAVTTSLNKPYRQRIYEVVKETDSTFVSYIYELPNDSLYIGAQADSPLFSKLKPADLTKKDGCEVRLTYNESLSMFSGYTGENTCPSNRQGASYATSIVEITEERMISWDRGFDSGGNQVWGATKGGYIFDKKR
jgi:CpeT protein